MELTGKNKENGQSVEHFLIVVGRQYGSGGRRIGRMLADRLGVAYYDKTLLCKAAESLGYSTEIFERADERRPSLLRSLLSFSYGATTSGNGEEAMSAEKLYEFQSQVIREICDRESCVIVGRTADYIMRHHPRMVSLFIHAPEEHRASALVRLGEAKELKEATETGRRRDRDRQSYYNYYTNSDNWGRAGNYHLSFDSSRISDDAILAAVRDMLGLV